MWVYYGLLSTSHKVQYLNDHQRDIYGSQLKLTVFDICLQCTTNSTANCQLGRGALRVLVGVLHTIMLHVCIMDAFGC